MRQEDAYKLLAAFMILIMIIVPVAYVVTSPRDQPAPQTNEQQSQRDKYNPEFWVVNQPFYSISDALKMTPDGALTADYADLESMTPQMVLWAKTQLPVDDVDSLYKSNTTKIYFAGLQNNSFLLLSTMFPEKNDFNYIVLPGTNYILRRQDTGAINILGNPAIYTSDKVASNVLGIISSTNKTTTAYDLYEILLSKVEPAPFQTISSNVSFAKQFYMGVRESNGSYARTTAYLNLNSSTLKKLNQLKANSTQKGFAQYNITRSGNYTEVKISGPDLSKLLTEEIS
ncbi:MAG: hypothetical protein PHU34_04765 [Candidatus Methanoperedens sp.]|nr:hypothetical protein [Candidatus Methanoperedens sp.]